jgi:glycosyltransferase involved in cell wall biosynthesis
VTTAGQAVTVVVPACNVERYLADCLDSLVSQTVWADCRVIVVDDGSTDSTASIAEEYSARYPAISVLRQANAGPGAGAARNHGLDEVGTEFVLFVDGDDTLTPTGIERLRAGVLADGLDLAVGATEQFPDARSWIWSDYFVPGQAQTVRIEQVPLLVHDARTCNKLYRTAWLRGLGLRFAEGIHHQDTVVNVPAMLLADRFSLVGDVVHRYRKRAEGGSVMDSHFTRVGNYWDHLRVIEELDAMRPRFLPSREPLMQAFIARSFQGFSWRAPEVLPREKLPEFFERAKAVISTLDPAIIESSTRDASERTGYVAMLEDDLDSFARVSELAGRLEAHDGDLYLGVPAGPALRGLLRTGATRALATGINSGRDGVRVQVRLRIRGARNPGAGVEHTLVRAFRGEAVAFSAPVAWTGTEGAESIGEVLIPWRQLLDGGGELRLHFRTATGNAARWLRRPTEDGAVGLAVQDTALNDRRARLRLGVGTEGRACLVVTPTLSLRVQQLLARLSRRFPVRT